MYKRQAVISIKIEDPQFESQTKQKLGNNEARGAVSAIVSEQLTYFLEQNPSVAKMICDKAILAPVSYTHLDVYKRQV